MKKRIVLLESDGYEPRSWCRREKVAGRLELLTAFFDGPQFWFVRLRNHSPADAEYLKETIGLKWFGNGHFRFVNRLDAEKRFAQLLALPKYATEAQKASERRERRREQILARIREGTMKSFGKTAQ
jgi:hypothetical protein